MAKIRSFSLKLKMHIFLILTVLAAAFGTASVAFYTSAGQINEYYKRCTADNAKNFASLVDGDFLAELRATAESEEFQALREQAEEADDEELIRDFLTEKGLWEKYSETQASIDKYLENMQDIKYIYISAHGDKNALYDMYLIDSSEEPIYETGYYEEREKEFLGLDLSYLTEPTISNGDWGWLCSAFCPVYDSDNNCVCIVGCDFGMDDVMAERRQFQIYLAIGALLFTLLIQLIAVYVMNRSVVRPLNLMTTEMKKFRPAEKISYKDAGVMDLPITSSDEIGALYHGIRSMQTDTIDRMNEMFALQEDKLKAEQDIINKKKQIDQLNEENSKDPLTGVGSKSAYARKIDELNQAIADGKAEFAIVMVDMNNLKKVNDEHGHKAGDQYIRGCCNMVCEAFKHSPVFRIGGDEFIVTVIGNDYKNRHEIFEKLKADFENSYNQENTEIWQRYSAALGMAENSFDDTTVDLVFRRADKAMYEDKVRFKNKHGSYR